MFFTTYAFIIFIILLSVVYYLIPRKYQWMLLLGASYLFYAFAGTRYLLYILSTTVSTYIISLRINDLHRIQTDFLSDHKDILSKEERKAYKASIRSRQWKLLLLCLLFNFGILAIVKYGNFAITNLNNFFQVIGSDKKLSFWTLALPLGISFYTFQTMGYIIDVYRAKYPAESNIFKLALFVSFFPQLIQGPISRFDDLSQTLFREHAYNYKNISFGAQRILWGYFKKLVIADRIAVAVNTIIGNPQTYQGTFVLVGMLFYACQLYADFTGGIDIAIGIAELFGIRIKENFERPYFSKSIAEYWRRWHISLGNWLKEYLFYPISVYKPMLDLSRFSRRHFGEAIGKRIPVYTSAFIVWFVTGIWHGSSWNFIVWGLMNCAVILISQECQPIYTRFHGRFHVRGSFLFRLFQVVRTVLLMSSMRLFDCYRDVYTTFLMFGSMFTISNLSILFDGELLNLGLTIYDYSILMIGIFTLLIVSLKQRRGSIRTRIANQPQFIRHLAYYALIIAIIILGAYGIGYDSSQFIYNQF